ncbi:claspin [Anopheles aquasalis]|uniref:claspin n=1 Tax=Anopheles aquasalis TaxID=42839 RepID=UPI00215B256A|nr:claspin [Anopheles aquasalis]
MDSDSELHATDTLRFDSDSEEDLESLELPQSHKDDGADEGDLHSTTANADQGDDEETIHTSYRNSKQASKIIDSDSDEEETMLPNAPDADTARSQKATTNAVDRLKSLLDSESESDSETVAEGLKKSNTEDGFNKKRNRGKPQSVLSDSDEEKISKSSTSSGNTRSKPARKKRVEKRKIITKINTAQDILASLQLRFSDEDSDAPNRDERKEESSSEEDVNDMKERNPHERRPPKKMTAHEAMEERRVIQSESQRMKREMAVDVPYHRARERTFEEFLSRKAIRRAPVSNSFCERTKKRDMSLKMTPEQLEAFSQQLQELEEESKAFYKSESDSSDDGPPEPPLNEKPSNPSESEIPVMDNHELKHEPKPQEGMEPPPLDTNPPGEAINLLCIDTGLEQKETEEMDTECTAEDANYVSNVPYETENKKDEQQREIDYDIAFEQQTESSVTGKKRSLLSTLDLPPCPRLSGQPGLAIDLDGGNIQLSEPTGIDILFKRLEKCGGGKKETSKQNTVSILSTDSGVVKLDVVPVLANEARPVAPKEPIPGAAFMKLQHVLKEQIINDRLETIKKREEEYAKKLEMEKAEKGETDDEEEELLDDDDVGSSENEEECASVAAPVLEANNDEGDDGESLLHTSSSEEEDNDDSDGMEKTNGKKGRIIRAFQDSDDETNEIHAIGERGPTADDKNEDPLSEDLRGEDDDKVVLMWKDDDEDPKGKEAEDEDLMALCSGQFVTQFPPVDAKSPSKDCAISTTQMNDVGCPLYTQDDAQPVAESQLMDLCSGRFETQADLQNSISTQKEHAPVDYQSPICPESTHATGTPVVAGRILCLESTDDEADQSHPNDRVKRVRKRKKKHVHLSDDEESDDCEEVSKPVLHEDGQEEDNEGEDEEMDDEESTKGANEEITKCIEYDSEENELEVVLSKKDKSKIAKNFVENEAELSESDWGSADEDEKELDRYDVEVADEEQFDQRQLQRELEKIHNRQMLDQDDRDVEQLKDLFLEDEEKEAGRIRQFRWKNVEKTFNLDYDKQAQDPEQSQENGDGSDEETEILWRKMRHERTMLLKEKKVELSETDEYETTLLNSANTTTLIEGQENNQSLGNVTAIGKRRVTIIKKRVATSVAPSKEEVPFLISNSSIAQGHKASFLSRDEETLSKIANLSKANPVVEGSSTALATKSRNFVFATLSPAVEVGSKRPLDSEESEEQTDVKRVKSNEPTRKKKLILDSLM